MVTDEEKSPQPWAVLTGDTLFIGDVGRPDLSKTHTPQQLAGLMYDSLHNKLLKLPDNVLVYPAHGAGSLCGRNMRAERSSTIGTERLTNYALQIKEPRRVRPADDDEPSGPPRLLPRRRGHQPRWSDTADGIARAEGDLRRATEHHAGARRVALDVRPGDEFAAGHVPGSVNIALSGQFASWAGAVLGLSSRPVLIAGTADQLSEARLRLARVGIEDVTGFLEGGVDGWKHAGFELAQYAADDGTGISDGCSRFADAGCPQAK